MIMKILSTLSWRIISLAAFLQSGGGGSSQRHYPFLVPLADHINEARFRLQLFDADVAKVFDVRRSLSARRATGAPSPDNVRAQIKHWRIQLRG